MAEAIAGDSGQGASALTYEQQLAQDKAAFLAGDSSPADKAKPTAEAVDDDDADLEADDAEEEDVELDADSDDETDDEDADLDDEDAPKLKLDPEAAKRMEQLRRTEQRMRERLDQQFAAREREIATREEQLKPRLEKLDRFEKLAARVRYEPEAVLLELGATEDDLDHATKRLYAFTKAGKADPKVREAVDRLAKERERDEELRSVKKKIEEQELEKKRAAEMAEQQRHVDDYVAKVTKLAGDKTPLTKRLFEADPESARAELEVIAGRIAQQTGKLPDHKTALIEFEKHQRKQLRRFGVDPRTLSPAQAAAAVAAKPTEKKPAKVKAKVEETDDKPLTKADFIRERRQY